MCVSLSKLALQLLGLLSRSLALVRNLLRCVGVGIAFDAQEGGLLVALALQLPTLSLRSWAPVRNLLGYVCVGVASDARDGVFVVLAELVLPLLTLAESRSSWSTLVVRDPLMYVGAGVAFEAYVGG